MLYVFIVLSDIAGAVGLDILHCFGGNLKQYYFDLKSLKMLNINNISLSYSTV